VSFLTPFAQAHPPMTLFATRRAASVERRAAEDIHAKSSQRCLQRVQKSWHTRSMKVIPGVCLF